VKNVAVILPSGLAGSYPCPAWRGGGLSQEYASQLLTLERRTS
jgi:hypothetical protein